MQADDRLMRALLLFAEGASVSSGVPHDHTTVVPGCFRCELSLDEVEAATEGDEGL